MALQEELESQGNFLFRYRGTLPLIILAVGLIVFALDIYQNRWLEKTWLVQNVNFIAIAICMLGVFIRAYTVGYTPANTSGRNTAGQLADELNTTGIYSTVRHPLYVGNFFMWLGVAVITMNFWFIIAFVLFYWIYYERIMFAEEQFLRGKFGETYQVWAKKTPAFIPSFTAWQKPKMSFSWRKVLKKEKNGFFAVFLVIFIFETVRDYIEKKIYIIDELWLIICVVASGLLYLVLKIIKKNTRWLDEEGR